MAYTPEPEEIGNTIGEQSIFRNDGVFSDLLAEILAGMPIPPSAAVPPEGRSEQSNPSQIQTALRIHAYYLREYQVPLTQKYSLFSELLTAAKTEFRVYPEFSANGKIKVPGRIQAIVSTVRDRASRMHEHPLKSRLQQLSPGDCISLFHMLRVDMSTERKHNPDYPAEIAAQEEETVTQFFRDRPEYAHSGAVLETYEHMEDEWLEENDLSLANFYRLHHRFFPRDRAMKNMTRYEIFPMQAYVNHKMLSGDTQSVFDRDLLQTCILGALETQPQSGGIPTKDRDYAVYRDVLLTQIPSRAEIGWLRNSFAGKRS